MKAVGRAHLALALVLGAALAGCAGSAPPEGSEPQAAAIASTVEAAHVVVAVIDSGINAYHAQFRDPSPTGALHPSTYLEGYPANATPLTLTLDAPDWQTAVRADCEAWNALEPGRLYYVPGTRIVGIFLSEDWATRGVVDCAAGEVPLNGLDTLAPHGSGAAGRAAGATTSLCPDCRIVSVQMGQNTWAMHWAAQQPWIDLQTNSWGGYLCHEVPAQTVCDRGPHELAREATALQVTFAASGNGVRHRDGTVTAEFGLGTPTYLKPAQGHDGVLVVGGHDNGDVLLWPGTMPHVVADAANHPSAAWNTTAEDDAFGGTSGATPFAAGTFAAMLLDARRLAGDAGTGLRGGDLVVAAAGATLPATGPLADGALSRAEAERLFLLTAVARPAEDQPFDGAFGCRPPDCADDNLYMTSAVAWSALPADVPAYYFVGYGQVGTASLRAATAILRGEGPFPVREAEDRFFAADAALRRALQD